MTSAMAKWADPAHKSAARMLGYVLTLDTQDAWWGLAPVLAARLTVKQRASLAFMALKSLAPATATLTAQAAISRPGAGMPIAPLFSVMDEAAFWADMAEPDEIEAYCLVCFLNMRDDRKSDFLAFAQNRAAA